MKQILKLFLVGILITTSCALVSAQTRNTLSGVDSGVNITTGDDNTVIGDRAGNTLIASDYLTDSGNSAPANGRWKDVSASYTSSASDPLLGELLEIRLIGYGVQTNYNYVRLTASPQ